MRTPRRYFQDLHRALTTMVTESLELLRVKLVLYQAGWRTEGSPAEDVRRLAEAWVDAERRAAEAEAESDAHL